MTRLFILILIAIGGLMGTVDRIYPVSLLYTVSGRIQYPGKGRIYIYLVDEEVFKTPLTGIKTIILDVDGPGSAEFIFQDVPEGEYGIRSYQDVNGNGKLDRGVFGPKEPWEMSWNADRQPGWPKFSHISFQVDGGTEPVNINLK